MEGYISFNTLYKHIHIYVHLNLYSHVNRHPIHFPSQGHGSTLWPIAWKCAKQEPCWSGPYPHTAPPASDRILNTNAAHSPAVPVTPRSSEDTELSVPCLNRQRAFPKKEVLNLYIYFFRPRYYLLRRVICHEHFRSMCTYHKRWERYSYHWDR